MENQTDCSRTVMKFYAAEWTNYETFVEECALCMEWHFYQKMFTNWLNMGLPLRNWVEKILHGMEIPWLSGWEKVHGAGLCKEGHAESILGHERIRRYRFPWRRATLTSATNFPFLMRSSPYLSNDPNIDIYINIYIYIYIYILSSTDRQCITTLQCG